MSLLLLFAGTGESAPAAVNPDGARVLRLGVSVYQDSTEATFIEDWTPWLSGGVVENDEHGYGWFGGHVRRERMADRFRLYELLPGRHVIASDGALTLFEGRIEDVELVDDGIEFGAYGYQRSLDDAPYTSLWSDTRGDQWRFTSDDELADDLSNASYQFEFVQDLVRVNLRPGEVYTGGNAGSAFVVYEGPHTAENDINYVTFDYEFKFPAANWIWRLISYAEGFLSGNVEVALTSSDSSVTSGSTSVTFATARPVIAFQALNNTGSDFDNTNSTTGYWYSELDNFRIQTTSVATITDDLVVDDVISFVNGLNSTQLSSATDAVQSPNVDRTIEVFQDEKPRDILNELAERGDDSSPPKLYAWDVWEKQILRFAPRGTDAMTWYVDAAGLQVIGTIDTLVNSAYGIYRDRNGRLIRTAVSDDEASQDIVGAVRRSAALTISTASTSATTKRDLVIEEGKDPPPRASLNFRHLFDKAGNRMPNYVARPGDTVVIRNLPPLFGSSVDKVRSFVIKRTRYDIDTDTLEVTPELDLPFLRPLMPGDEPIASAGTIAGRQARSLTGQGSAFGASGSAGGSAFRLPDKSGSGSGF